MLYSSSSNSEYDITDTIYLSKKINLMPNALWSILGKWKEKIGESLPKVWSALTNTLGNINNIRKDRWKNTIGDRATKYYGKAREQTKSDFNYFDLSSWGNTFKTLWTKPKALIRDPLKWIALGTGMTLGWAALSLIPNTAVATGKWIITTSKWVLGTWARVRETTTNAGIAMAWEWVTKVADWFDMTGGKSDMPKAKVDAPESKNK